MTIEKQPVYLLKVVIQLWLVDKTKTYNQLTTGNLTWLLKMVHL